MKRLLFIVILLFSIKISAQALIAEIGKFSEANSFYINPAGYIYVVDSDNNEVVKIDTLGNVLFTTGGYGWGEAAFDEPSDIYATTLKVYVADKNNHRIQEFDKDLNYRLQFNADEENYSNYSFAYPTSCAISNHGDFFILDSDNQRILKYNLTGGFLLEIGNYDYGEYMLSNPQKLAISPDGKIFVLDKNQVIVYDQFGTGLLKLTPEFSPSNINITFNNMVLNSSKNIKYLDLTNTKNGFIHFNIKEYTDEIIIIECSLFNKKMYVLTPNSILIFTLI